jgi:hypothetical protein
MSCAKSGVPKKGAKIPKVSEHDVPKHSEIFAHFFGKCTGGWGGGWEHSANVLSEGDTFTKDSTRFTNAQWFAHRASAAALALA